MTGSNAPITEDEILSKLGGVSFFSMFVERRDVLSMILKLSRRRSFQKGKYIIREGESGDALFIILHGAIDVIKNTLQNEAYTVTNLDAVEGGINVGEMALIDNDRRSASVVARTDCECLEIDRDDFIAFGDRNPEFGLAITRAIARQLSESLRKSNSDVITLFSALVEEIASTQ